MNRISWACVAGLALAGCALAPAVTKQRMTLGEAGISGLECRRVLPIGTNQKKTICASPQAWKQIDEKDKAESDLMFQAARGNSNNSRFNRGN
jgi:hypothetical protein